MAVWDRCQRCGGCFRHWTVNLDVVISLPTGTDSKADYAVMGVYGKHYNKWYLTQQDAPPKVDSKNTVRLHVRKVAYDVNMGLHKLVNESGTDVYRQVDIKEVEQIRGKLEQQD